jgi:hypothetical protein
MTTAVDQTLQFIVGSLHEKQMELQEFIGNGTIKDFNEYHRLCGVIQGLTFAKEIITGLAKRLETDDDE